MKNKRLSLLLWPNTLSPLMLSKQAICRSDQKQTWTEWEIEFSFSTSESLQKYNNSENFLLLLSLVHASCLKEFFFRVNRSMENYLLLQYFQPSPERPNSLHTPIRDVSSRTEEKSFCAYTQRKTKQQHQQMFILIFCNKS